MKIRPVGAEVFYAGDRRTDMTKLVASPLPTCAQDGHLQSVMIPDAV